VLHSGMAQTGQGRLCVGLSQISHRICDGRHASPSTGAVAAAEALGFSFGTAAALQETIAGQQESVNSSILGLQ
jgi:hypothetical protein